MHLNEGSYRLLSVLGLWDIVKKNSQPITKILLQQGSSISSIQPFELKFTTDLKKVIIYSIWLKKYI